MPRDFNTLLIANDLSPELPSLRETILTLVVPSSRDSGTVEAQLRTAASLQHAINEIKAGLFPDLAIVYQGIPDEFPQSQIDELIGLIPLARIVIAFGPWCESIGRTEQRWPIAWCVPIRHLAARLQRELASLESGETTPPTASRDEAFSESASRVNSTGTSGDLTAAVFGDDAHFVGTVCDQIAAAGLQTSAESLQPDLVFLSASILSSRTESELARLKSRFPSAGLIMICDLLTPNQIERLQSENVTPMSQLRFGEELATFIGAAA